MKFFYYRRKYPLLLGVMTILILVGTAFSINIEPTRALLGFGVIVGSPVSCVDEGSIAIIVAGLPIPGAYLYTPATLAFTYYNYFVPGTWVLGGYIPTPGLTCTNLGVPILVPVGAIYEIGSALAPLPI
ncbi:MAG: hypothetical protein AAB649_07275 [Patescibacteria group bacterium]